MTREQLDALENLAKKATPGPWELECPIDDDNPWIVEAGKPTYEWRCLAMVTKSGDGINATEGSANGDLVTGLRNNATELLAAARRALELEEALEWAIGNSTALYKMGRGLFCCSYSSRSFVGATPLEAIQNARRDM